MNIKKNYGWWLMGTLISILLALGIFYLGDSIYKEIHDYNSYKSFCEERKDFCYCSWSECEFKASSFTKYTNGELIDSGMSNDTISLCNLAKELNDKKMLFKVGCK